MPDYVDRCPTTPEIVQFLDDIDRGYAVTFSIRAYAEAVLALRTQLAERANSKKAKAVV